MPPPPPRQRGGSGPILYQIDFMAVAAGKRVPTSKRRVRWRFGFANPEALRSGQTGTACRGEEHDVTLVWSLTSGKRMVLADGHEVHFSNSRSNVFDYSWTMKGNHVLKIVAHANTPLSPTPGFRQYDFFVNGQSFFGFPKVFRLGLAPNDPRGQISPSNAAMMAESSRRPGSGRNPGGVGGPRHSANNIASLEAPGNQDEEEAYLQEAIRQSLKDDAKPKPAPPPAPPVDLLDFGDSNPTPGPEVPPAASFGGVESVQSDPYYGGQPTATNLAHQSFTSLPAITAGYGPPPTDFAAAAASGALVVAAPSTGYGGYGVPPTNNPYGAAAAATQPSSNPYALVPVPNPSATPYQYMPPQSYPAAPAPYGNAYETGSNPYGAPASSVNPYAAPTAANPYAAPMNAEQPPPSTNPYGAAAAPSNPYLAPIPATSSNPYAVPAPTNPYGSTEVTDNKSAWTPPAPITTQPNPYDSTVPTQPYETFNGGFVPQAVTPHAQQTPSSLGFGSPAPDFSGFTPAAEEKTTGGAAQLSTPFGNLTMHGLASVDEAAPPTQEQNLPTPQQSTSVVQSTFAKLASLDNFSVSSNSDAKRMNPFESPANASVGGGRSLADMAKNKSAPAKEIMKTPMPAQAPAATTNPYGQYSNQYGMQSAGGFGQPASQPLNTFGQVAPQPTTQPMYNPPSTFGPPPSQAIQQPFDQHPAPMAQPAYGQPTQQPPAGIYGQQQPPPVQQQPQYGFNQQQQPPPHALAANPYGQAPAYPPQPGYY